MKILRSLKFQFILGFSFFIVILILITAVLGIRQLASAVEETFAEKGVYIAEKAVSIIDGNSFERLARTMDINDPYYEEARIKLLDLKELSGCLYLYTMAPPGGDLQQTLWQFIIDGSDEPGGEEFSELGDEDDSMTYEDAFRNALISGRTETAQLSHQGEWGWLISVYSPIKNSAGKTVGIVGVDFDGEPLHQAIVKGRTQKIIIGIVSLIIGLALLLLFSRMIFTRLHKINIILKEISLGEGDLTKRIKIDKEDEIGELSTYFNMTLDKIMNLIVAIKEESVNLHNISNDLTSNMQKTAGAVHHITDNIQTIKQKVTSQSASVSQTHATMEKVTGNIEKLGKNVEAQTNSVTESSSAIEEMLANIHSVTQTLVRNAQNVQELIRVSDAGRVSLQKVIQDIQEIARESEGLLEINTVMENIASQTNLLSMNAAIEAAHAGEAGKGFAVVAGEIRKLATNSSEQSQTISEVLRKIKTAIDTITVSTNNVLAQFQAIDERVRIVSDQETNIRNAMEEQGQGSQRILQAVSELNETTQMVKKGSDEMKSGSKEIITESINSERATVEISLSMNEMASGTKEINDAINHLSEISVKTSEYIESLFVEVSRFKVT
ncbi:MAG: methyl-accepting chemotaxis protein [Treponema sp.]|nr:methyl-accepting chemotaxis protein [Treponema sp.]